MSVFIFDVITTCFLPMHMIFVVHFSQKLVLMMHLSVIAFVEFFNGCFYEHQNREVIVHDVESKLTYIPHFTLVVAL